MKEASAGVCVCVHVCVRARVCMCVCVWSQLPECTCDIQEFAFSSPLETEYERRGSVSISRLEC